jgi:trk system potassium uptake protein TrkA
MKVVIAGGGSVGRFTAEQLVEAGHEVTIIENDRAVVREYADDETTGVKWHQGDACDVSVLAAAGVTMADVVASVTGDDEDNLVVSLLAKQEFGVPRVVARVNNPNNYWMFNEMWGVDVSVSTPHLITSLVQEAVAVGSFVRLMQL